ncbi:MAG TPA: MBL fold metallo-hydrolase [Thermoanaerobaculia bacterium]|nr:MBL fold metallo-hydrolase [Thermoanaerobaculia bacterium]
MITNSQSGTSIHEIAHRVYRISTPLPPQVIPGGFSFNQYLIDDEQPVVFHSGPKGMFPLVRQAIETVLPIARIRFVGLSHFESDECGALNEFLAVAPAAAPLCSRTAALVSVNDFATRPPRALGDGETLRIGSRELQWIDTPHLPHNWETGYLFDRGTATLFCGDLFTQGGLGERPLTNSDILSSSEEFRAVSDTQMPEYFANTDSTRRKFERLAALRPKTLACMHGSAWNDGTESGAADLLMGLADAIDGQCAATGVSSLR